MSTVKSKKLQVGTDATSSNNFTIAQPSSPNGTLEIGQGNADSYTKVGEFNANGYKPAQPVAFRAYSTTSQTGVSGGVSTKILFDTEEFDTGNNYASSKFTAPVNGYYHFTSATHMQGPNGAYDIQLWINGVRKVYFAVSYSNGTNVSPALSEMVYLNASDYVEIYGRSATATTFYGGASLTFFSGILISQA